MADEPELPHLGENFIHFVGIYDLCGSLDRLWRSPDPVPVALTLYYSEAAAQFAKKYAQNTRT
ncbi:MAG: hypothetical protein DDT36_01501 [Firmicutes bacterium]|nr:hypothetical protein [Bacillota bacterium]